jgi:hypothetical protein
MITLTLKGTENGDMVDFEGTALQLPGDAFKAVLTPSAIEAICPRKPAAAVEKPAVTDYCGSLGIFSANPLKHISRSSSSLLNRQSLTAFAAGALGFGCGGKMAS